MHMTFVAESVSHKVARLDDADDPEDYEEDDDDNDDHLTILQTKFLNYRNQQCKKNRVNFDILKIQTIFPFYEKTKLFFL